MARSERDLPPAVRGLLRPEAYSHPAKDIELHEDAWPRFERFIQDVAKAGPQHRTKPAKSPGSAAKPKTKEKTTRHLR